MDSIKTPIEDSYLVGDFVKKCELKKVTTIELPCQWVGNCSWKSLEGLVLALIMMHLYKHNTREGSILQFSPEESLDWAEVDAKKIFDLFLAEWIA